MQQSKLKFHIQREYWGDVFSLHIFGRDEQTGRRLITLPVTRVLQTSEQDGSAPAPAMSLLSEQCQALMDELWHVGFRPTEGSGSAGSLAATQRHLEDMRSLVFKTKPETKKT